MRIIICWICGKEIPNKNWNKKFCSKCRIIRDQQLRRIRDEEKKLLRLKNKKWSI